MHPNQRVEKRTDRRIGYARDLNYTGSSLAYLETKKVCTMSWSDKRSLVTAHYYITQHMVNSLGTESKDESKYRLLPTTIEIIGKFCESIFTNIHQTCSEAVITYNQTVYCTSRICRLYMGRFFLVPSGFRIGVIYKCIVTEHV